jgi:hypothetical protein
MHLLSRHIARVSTLTVALVAVTACGGESSTPPSGGGTGLGGTGSGPPPPPPPPPRGGGGGASLPPRINSVDGGARRPSAGGRVRAAADGSRSRCRRSGRSCRPSFHRRGGASRCPSPGPPGRLGVQG